MEQGRSLSAPFHHLFLLPVAALGTAGVPRRTDTHHPSCASVTANIFAIPFHSSDNHLILLLLLLREHGLVWFQQERGATRRECIARIEFRGLISWPTPAHTLLILKLPDTLHQTECSKMLSR
jgi:hypothetical protein